MKTWRVWLLLGGLAGNVGCAQILGIDHEYGERPDDLGDAGEVSDTGLGDDGDVLGPPDAGDDAAADAGVPSGFDCQALDGTVFGGHCYFTIGPAMGLSWSSARTQCGTFSNAHLVTVTSAQEQTALEGTFLPSTTDYWIGLSLQGASTQTPPASCKTNPRSCPFQWTTREPLSYAKWARRAGSDSEPNYSGACVRVQAMDTMSWADVGCDSVLPAICEHD